MGLRLTRHGSESPAGVKQASQPRRTYRPPKNALCFTCVDEASVEVVERWGRFNRIALPGFNCICCCFGEQTAGRLSLQVQHQEVQCEARTKDGVFTDLVFSVQYRAREEEAYRAFYMLAEPQQQIASYVLDAVAASVALMTIDEVFANKAAIAHSVRGSLGGAMDSFGYTLLDCLVTSVGPTGVVREAMNSVKAAQRHREAAVAQGDAEKIRGIKAAEAAAEARYLYGQGWARFLQALAAGIRDSAVVLVTGKVRQQDLSFPPPPLPSAASRVEAVMARPVVIAEPAAPAVAASPQGPVSLLG